MIFPEGGIVQDQPVRPLKSGFARLVLQAEATMEGESIPVVPIAIHYQPDAQRGAAITIHICPPLRSRDYQQADEKHTAQELTEAVQNSLLAGLEQIR
jgi:1-acyl-sn-glycerol-3-phosphate acyltransferase